MIPRVIHRVWLGGDEPEWTKPFSESWRQAGWNLLQWTDDNVDDLFPLHNQDLYDDAQNIAPNNVGQLRSDILRYEILYRIGGIYADHDFECLKPLDPLLEGVDSFAAWETQDKWIANGLMGCTPGHPFLDELIGGIPDRVSATRGKGFRPNRITGPHYLTAQWRKWGEGVEILPQELIFPYNWREILFYGTGDTDWGDAYTVHHWHNMRREKGVDPCPA